MNNSIHRISLDIHDTASQASINAKKGDTARSIYITLQENGKPYRIAEGCYAVLSGVKPDGNFLFNDCTIKDNIIAYDFTEQTVPAVGQVNCEVILYDANNNRITSPHFVIIVNDVVYNDEEIVSSDEATALITATADAKAITAEVEQKLANGEFVGEKGDKGEQGDRGEKGEKGDKGDDADPQLFANAVKGYAEGTVVRVDDVSPVEHIVNVKLSSAELIPFEDYSGITIYRSGKNLLNQSQHGNHSFDGVTIEYLPEEDCFLINGETNGKTLNTDVKLSPYIVGEVGANYTISAKYISGNITYDGNGTYAKPCLRTCSSLGDASNTSWIETPNMTLRTSGVIATKALTEKYISHIRFYITPKVKFDNYKVRVQLEKGNIETDYEKYVAPTEYTPSADGTVDGITSLSPTMTLLTDTEGAVIRCEYNRDTNKVISTMQTAEGTVVSQNADFAEVAEWADGNPNNEDRTGYFVCANVPVDGIVMKKATSIDDVKGVTILAPAFAGNYTKDKVDSNGNLLPKYSYVAIIGFVPVRDNGTCTVGGRCMPDDNGCAIPSSNSMGYQVVNRIDENRVLIIIEPNGDMVQRIKAKVNQMQEDIDNFAPDQTYNPESENAQSGKAVAQAVANLGGGSDYELLTENTLSTDAYINITLPFPCRSVFIDFSKVGSNQGEQYWWINNKSGGKFSFGVRKPSSTLQSSFYEIEFTLENGLCTVASDYSANTYVATTPSRVARYVGDTDTALTGVRSATPYLSGTSYKVYVRRT